MEYFIGKLLKKLIKIYMYFTFSKFWDKKDPIWGTNDYFGGKK